jgi:hypothetical protein
MNLCDFIFKPNKMIIGLIGKKQVGKDTVADYLIRNHGFIKYAYADPLKAACKILFLLSDEQLHNNKLKETVDPRWGMTPRQIFQLVGTDLFRKHVDSEFWVRHFEMWVRQQPRDTNIVISDVRFQNEANIIKKNSGMLIHLRRSNNYVDTHSSEQQDIRGADYTIDNNSSPETLYKQIEKLLHFQK